MAAKIIDIEELVHLYSQGLWAASLAIGFSQTDAEELVQQTFVAFLGVLDRFEGRSQIKTYLFGILYNKASEMRRKQKKEESLDAIEEAFGKRFDAQGMWASPPLGPEDVALTKEIRDWVAQCAENLSLSQQAAFFLKEVEGESSEAICNILGISYTNLRVLLFRARIKLRECLERHWK